MKGTRFRKDLFERVVDKTAEHNQIKELKSRFPVVSNPYHGNEDEKKFLPIKKIKTFENIVNKRIFALKSINPFKLR